MKSSANELAPMLSREIDGALRLLLAASCRR